MAGAGLKNFTAGEVLTAADVNTFLAQQTVQVYATAAARTAAVPTPSEGMVSYLKDFNITESYDGTNWHPIDSVLNVRTAATASFSIGATDAGDLLQVNSTGSGTVVVTVPPDSTYDFPIGVQVNLLSVGTATVATAAGTGVTLNGTPGLLLRAQYSSATLLKRAANTWVVIGDLKA
jgi:hypothetical protein